MRSGFESQGPPLSLPGSHDSELRGGKERLFATYPSYFTVANSEDEEQIKASKESHGKVLPLPSSHYFFDLGSRPRCLSSATSHDIFVSYSDDTSQAFLRLKKTEVACSSSSLLGRTRNLLMKAFRSFETLTSGTPPHIYKYRNHYLDISR